jgi:hypothetical protein
LHNEEVRDLYSSPSIIRIIKSRRMRWAGHVARIGEKRNSYRLLVGKPEGKRPLGRPRRRWVDNTGCGKLASFFRIALKNSSKDIFSIFFIRKGTHLKLWFTSFKNHIG